MIANARSLVTGNLPTPPHSVKLDADTHDDARSRDEALARRSVVGPCLEVVWLTCRALAPDGSTVDGFSCRQHGRWNADRAVGPGHEWAEWVP